MGDLQSHDDHYGYSNTQACVETYLRGEEGGWQSYEEMLSDLMKIALEERCWAMYHAIDIAGQLL
jgi:hypothetical protein